MPALSLSLCCLHISGDSGNSVSFCCLFLLHHPPSHYSRQAKRKTWLYIYVSTLRQVGWDGWVWDRQFPCSMAWFTAHTHIYFAIYPTPPFAALYSSLPATIHLPPACHIACIFPHRHNLPLASSLTPTHYPHPHGFLPHTLGMDWLGSPPSPFFPPFLLILVWTGTTTVPVPGSSPLVRWCGAVL